MSAGELPAPGRWLHWIVAPEPNSESHRRGGARECQSLRALLFREYPSDVRSCLQPRVDASWGSGRVDKLRVRGVVVSLRWLHF